jgi:hypothetical protein
MVCLCIYAYAEKVDGETTRLQGIIFEYCSRLKRIGGKIPVISEAKKITPCNERFSDQSVCVCVRVCVPARVNILCMCMPPTLNTKHNRCKQAAARKEAEEKAAAEAAAREDELQKDEERLRREAINLKSKHHRAVQANILGC